MILTEKEIYEEFKIEYPQSKLTFEGYYKIVKRILLEIFKEVLYDRKVFIFPFCKMGFISIVKSTHKLRHTAATLMYRYGKVDIRTLQELLGHESISTTEIYTHLDKEQLQDAVDKNPLSSFSRTTKKNP